MLCTSPLDGFLCQKHNGKIRFYKTPPLKIKKVIRAQKMPCGQCRSCRIDYSRQWAFRAMHESLEHPFNSFLTLTYNNENLPLCKSICKRHMQLFIKRLRERISPRLIRYIYCGEYGSSTQRPHYHILLFGYDFPDKIPHSVDKGNVLHTSALLSELWPKGFHYIGELNWKSAAYVCRYILKKQNGMLGIYEYCDFNEKTGEINSQIATPFIEASRNPGIGQKHFLKYRESIMNVDHVCTVDGIKSKIPRYYEKLHEKLIEGNPLETCKHQNRKHERRMKAKQKSKKALHAQNSYKQSVIEKLKRSLDYES